MIETQPEGDDIVLRVRDVTTTDGADGAAVRPERRDVDRAAIVDIPKQFDAARLDASDRPDQLH
ncbi:MAG: hypothetical protein AAFY56_07390 [Pseudomonadota bacterium]